MLHNDETKRNPRSVCWKVCLSDWEKQKIAHNPSWIELEISNIGKSAKRGSDVWTEDFLLCGVTASSHARLLQVMIDSCCSRAGWSFRCMCVRRQRYSGNVLVVSRVWYGSVHPQFVTFHLVELVSGIRILTWSDDCGSNIQVLVKVLPVNLTYTQRQWTNLHFKWVVALKDRTQWLI